MRNFAIFGLLMTIVLVVIAAFYKRSQEAMEENAVMVEPAKKD